MPDKTPYNYLIRETYTGDWVEKVLDSHGFSYVEDRREAHRFTNYKSAAEALRQRNARFVLCSTFEIVREA